MHIAKRLAAWLVIGYLALSAAGTVSGQAPRQARLLYGVAYYDEYMPYDRLAQDVRMMKEAGINVVRIAESTWSTMEPHDGVFDFTHIDRVLDAMHRASIDVIVGTPTYAVPTWLVRKYPDVLAVTPRGPNQYGARQNMDITNPRFRTYAERAIRKMLEHVKAHPAIIGYQVDNETKHYQTAGPAVQALFVRYIRDKFKTVDAVNRAFGLDYWSNRINAWEDFPSTVGSINASLNAEFAKFQRQQRKAELWGADQDVQFPVITKSGTNQDGKTVRYYFNYSAEAAAFRYPHGGGKDLLSGAPVAKGSEQRLPAWGVMIVLED